MNIGNVSDLADTSDYVIRAIEHGAPHLGIKPLDAQVEVKRHKRKQSVFVLIAKAALAVLKDEK